MTLQIHSTSQIIHICITWKSHKWFFMWLTYMPHTDQHQTPRRRNRKLRRGFYLVHKLTMEYMYICLITRLSRGRITSPTPQNQVLEGGRETIRLVSMQVHFPCWVPPCRFYWLAEAISSVGLPWTSSTCDFLLQGQPEEQGCWPWSAVPCGCMARVGTDGLCR